MMQSHDAVTCLTSHTQCLSDVTGVVHCRSGDRACRRDIRSTRELPCDPRARCHQSKPKHCWSLCLGCGAPR